MPTVITLITSVGGITIGGVATWVATRRKTSGQINTSDAATLWAQSESMRNMLMEEKHKAEEQRDRLIEAHATGVLPTLATLDQSLRELAASVTVILAHEKEQRLLLERLLRRAGDGVQAKEGGPRASG